MAVKVITSVRARDARYLRAFANEVRAVAGWPIPGWFWCSTVARSTPPPTRGAGWCVARRIWPWSSRRLIASVGLEAIDDDAAEVQGIAIDSTGAGVLDGAGEASPDLALDAAELPCR